MIVRMQAGLNGLGGPNCNGIPYGSARFDVSVLQPVLECDPAQSRARPAESRLCAGECELHRDARMDERVLDDHAGTDRCSSMTASSTASSRGWSSPAAKSVGHSVGSIGTRSTRRATTIRWSISRSRRARYRAIRAARSRRARSSSSASSSDQRLIRACLRGVRRIGDSDSRLVERAVRGALRRLRRSHRRYDGSETVDALAGDRMARAARLGRFDVPRSDAEQPSRPTA